MIALWIKSKRSYSNISQSETSPLADTSSYVEWKSLQWSPLPPPWPVWSSGAKVIDWHSAPSVEVTTWLSREICNLNQSGIKRFLENASLHSFGIGWHILAQSARRRQARRGFGQFSDHIEIPWQRPRQLEYIAQLCLFYCLEFKRESKFIVGFMLNKTVFI